MRIALGAPAVRVKGMVLRQGLMLSLAGVTIGLGLSVGLTRLMSGLLFGVSPVDPITYGAVATGLVVVALVMPEPTPPPLLHLRQPHHPRPHRPHRPRRWELPLHPPCRSRWRSREKRRMR